MNASSGRTALTVHHGRNVPKVHSGALCDGLAPVEGAFLAMWEAVFNAAVEDANPITLGFRWLKRRAATLLQEESRLYHSLIVSFSDCGAYPAPFSLQ